MSFFSEQEQRDLQFALQMTRTKGDLPYAFRLKSWLVENCDWFSQPTVEIYRQLEEWGVKQLPLHDFPHPPREGRFYQ